MNIPNAQRIPAALAVLALTASLLAALATPADAWAGTRYIDKNDYSWQITQQYSTDYIDGSASDCGGSAYGRHDLSIMATFDDTSNTHTTLRSMKVKNHEPYSITIDYMEFSSGSSGMEWGERFGASWQSTTIPSGATRELRYFDYGAEGGNESLPYRFRMQSDGQMGWILWAHPTNNTAISCWTRHSGVIIAR